MTAMTGQGEDRSNFGPIINDLRTRLVVSHVHREGNSATHRLARLGLNCTQEIVWFEESPYLIHDILFEEGL
ncbi:hypothetical protein DVH24_037600 [Malus domestica]|uniref:RNase H type-1 domain-containing protein n=1 Tax=Malus domestica TaxID=3750 RepID=A0A498J009_MALDO|nr:hypothetical protein DVH24_037600 [Malus domestica]